MKNVALAAGLALVVAASAYACGSDVTDTGSTTSTTASAGGSGGTTTVTSSTASSTGAGGFANVCEEMCNHLEVDCQLPNACGVVGPLLNVDFDACMMEAECISNCLVDEDCATIGSIIGMNPDPMLIACVTGCQPNSCLGCVLNGCQTEAMACNAEPVCQAFIQCLAQCGPGDAACTNMCANMNPSTETTNLLNCANTNCPSQCLGQGGGGGAGGAGGAGGN